MFRYTFEGFATKLDDEGNGAEFTLIAFTIYLNGKPPRKELEFVSAVVAKLYLEAQNDSGETEAGWD